MRKAKKNYHTGKALLCMTAVCLCAVALMTTMPTIGFAASENAGRKETLTTTQGAGAASADTVLTAEREDNIDQLVKIDSDDRMLTLVNVKNPLPDDYKPKLKSLKNGLQFDERAIDQLNEMLSAARKQGLSPVVCSAYRSIEKQTTLFENQVKKQMAIGLSREQAEIEAGKSVAYPGTSEHNLGLAADIVSLDYQLLDENQAKTPEAKWLLAHCSEYGFILRYPEGKTDMTGIIYEPWHFRYVGIETAKEIMERGICLEEYLDYIGDK